MYVSPLPLPLASLASILSRRTHHSLPLRHAQRMDVRMNRIQAVIGQKASVTGAASHISIPPAHDGTDVGGTRPYRCWCISLRWPVAARAAGSGGAARTRMRCCGKRARAASSRLRRRRLATQAPAPNGQPRRPHLCSPLPWSKAR